MQIAGLVRTSLVDYPGCVSAVVFTYGCNFRCPFCHNPDLVCPRTQPRLLDIDGLLDFLKKRRGRLDGVVVTGGEPALQPGLLPFLRVLKDLGYRVKLDTNGSRPDVLQGAIAGGLVDYLAVDLKAPLPNYAAAAGVPVAVERIAESIRAVRESGVSYEFRTTAVRPLHTPEDLVATGKMAMGADGFVLQRFVNGRLLDPSFSKAAVPFEETELDAVCTSLQAHGVNCIVR